MTAAVGPENSVKQTGSPTPDLLQRLGVGIDHLDEYQTAWSIRCPQCGVADALCLNNQGQRQTRPHSVRLGVARRATSRGAR
jgi:hypothetical protein